MTVLSTTEATGSAVPVLRKNNASADGSSISPEVTVSSTAEATGSAVPILREDNASADEVMGSAMPKVTGSNTAQSSVPYDGLPCVPTVLALHKVKRWLNFERITSSTPVKKTKLLDTLHPVDCTKFYPGRGLQMLKICYNKI